MAIRDDFDAFIQEHRRCGELRNGTSTDRGEVVWIDCSCGGQMAKPTVPMKDDPE